MFFAKTISRLRYGKRIQRLYSDKPFKDTAINNQAIKFAFKDSAKITQILAKYPPQYKKAAVMPLLQLGQEEHGWTSISVMDEVARILEMPPMRVYEVATFYTMFNREPVGKHHIQVCTTTPCQLRGADKILKALEKEIGIKLGETSKDSMFTLTEVECSGACVNAPVLSINDQYYEDLTEESVKTLVDSLRKGKKIKPGPMSGRSSCEPAGGLTTLLEPAPGPGHGLRSDL